MSSSTNDFTETLFKNSRPETSVNSYLNGAVMDSREKGSHEKFLTVLFHEYPPDTLESINDQRGKAVGKTSIISVSADFSSDIGSKVKLSGCRTPKSQPTPRTTNKTMESARIT